MSRTIGARDLRPRRHRKDIGKKRKYYRGKLVKTKRQIKRERRIGNKDHIKIWIVEEKPMSIDGAKRWNKRVRRYARKLVYKPLNVHLVHVTEINTQDKIENFVAYNYWDGVFLVRGFSHAKTKTKVKPVKICKIRVKETSKGMKGHMVNNWRLSRYSWFYKG